MNNKKTYPGKIGLLLLLLIIPALACSTTIIKSAPAEMNNKVFPTEPALPSPSSTLAITATTIPGVCEVTADALHLRDSPNAEGTVIAWLEQGDQLIILPTKPSGNWIQVKFESITGWVNSTYCERK